MGIKQVVLKCTHQCHIIFFSRKLVLRKLNVLVIFWALLCVPQIVKQTVIAGLGFIAYYKLFFER